MSSRTVSLPRAVFTMYAPRFMPEIMSASNMCSVPGCSGQLSVTTSQCFTISLTEARSPSP